MNSTHADTPMAGLHRWHTPLPRQAAPDAQRIAPWVTVVMLVHAALLLLAHAQPEPPANELPRIIDVALEMNTPAAVTPPSKASPPPPRPAPQTPAPAAPATPPPALPPEPAPAPVETPPLPAAPPQPAAPAVAATSPEKTAPSREESSAAEIQPLYKLTRLPGFTRKVEASYPAAERRAGREASVLAEVTIDAQGNVLLVRILKSGGAAFDEAVKQALQASQFSPGLIDGRPVGTRFQVPYRFALN